MKNQTKNRGEVYRHLSAAIACVSLVATQASPAMAQAQGPGADASPHNRVHATPAEIRQLHKSGVAAQNNRRAQKGKAAARPVRRPAATNNIRKPMKRPDFTGSAYRQHAAQMGRTGNLQMLEQRGYQARRARPTQSITGELDLTPNERLGLQRTGQQARIARGVRPGFQGPNMTNARASAAPKALRSSGKLLAQSASFADRAAVIDFGAEAFGGESTGIGEFGTAMTIGQLDTFAKGDDPIKAMTFATNAFGDSLVKATHGVGQSIIDPRRIPGNIEGAVTGVAQSGIGLAEFAVKKTAKTVDDGARFMTDPRYAEKQIKYGTRKVGKTVQNIGKSTCKGISTLLGIKKTKC